MTGYLFRIAALSLAIVAGLAVPTISEGLGEMFWTEIEVSDDTLS